MMKRSEAIESRRRLSRIIDLKVVDALTWLAIIEDELLLLVSEKSKSLERFREIRDKAKDALKADRDGQEGEEYANHIRPQIVELLNGVRDLIDSEIYPPDDLKDEVERIILKGYFQSVYFRAILVCFGLLLFLVTGVEGYKLTEQVKAMQKFVDDARARVEQSNIEVAKGTNEVRDRQASLALMILEGNEELIRARIRALDQIEADRLVATAQVQEAAKEWNTALTATATVAKGSITEAGVNGTKDVQAQTIKASKEYDIALAQGKERLSEKLLLSLSKLERSEHPWAPLTLWSMQKTWLLVPITLLVAFLSWLSSFSKTNASEGVRVIVGLAIFFIPLIALGLIYWLR